MGFNTLFVFNLYLFSLIYKSDTWPTTPYGKGGQPQIGQTRALDDFFQSVALGEVSRGSATLLQLWGIKAREGKRMKKISLEKITGWWGDTISRSDLFSCPNISFTVSLPDSMQTVFIMFEVLLWNMQIPAGIYILASPPGLIGEYHMFEKQYRGHHLQAFCVLWTQLNNKSHKCMGCCKINRVNI